MKFLDTAESFDVGAPSGSDGNSARAILLRSFTELDVGLTAGDLNASSVPDGTHREAVAVSLAALVGNTFGVSVWQLSLRTRGKTYVSTARQLAMYLAHVTCGLSLTEVGRLFGRDRTTVAHACQVVETRRDEPDYDGALIVFEGIAAYWLANLPCVSTAGCQAPADLPGVALPPVKSARDGADGQVEAGA